VVFLESMAGSTARCSEVQLADSQLSSGVMQEALWKSSPAIALAYHLLSNPETVADR